MAEVVVMDGDIMHEDGFFPLPNVELFERLKNLADDHEALLVNLQVFYIAFQPIHGSSLSLNQRRKLFNMGAAEFVMKLMSENLEDEEIHVWAWRILRDSICFLDNENPAEYETVNRAVEIGVVEAIVRELTRVNSRPRVLWNVFSSLTTICLAQEHAEKIISCGVVESCLRIVNLDVSEDFSTSALGSLKNLAISKRTHAYLLKAGSIRVANEAMHFLSSDNNYELKLGLCAASLICRLIENQEVGEGTDVVYGNKILYYRLEWLLKKVLSAGSRGTVIGSGWNPANIILDISILANHDRSKSLLVAFIPLLYKALKTRGAGNSRLVKYAVQTLVELSSDPVCAIEIGEQNKEFFMILKKLRRSPLLDVQSFQNISLLLTLEGKKKQILF